MRESFSRRYGYDSQHSDLTYEDAPQQARQGLREVLADCGLKQPSSQRGIICQALRVRPDLGNWSEFPNVDGEVDELLYGLVWYKFYDLCENIARTLGPEREFEPRLNAVFQEERIGYRMEQGKIVKIGSEEFHEAVAQARQFLDRPGFEVPLRQFSKALNFRNDMPPDHANAVKEAVNAVEGVWQVVANMPGTAMPTVLSGLAPPLPSGLRKVYDGLYGYGSGSEGARHAGVGGHNPEAEEAEFIIHMAAAAMSYAIMRFGPHSR